MHTKFSAFFSPHAPRTPCRCFGTGLKKCLSPISPLNSSLFFFFYFLAEKIRLFFAWASRTRVSLSPPFLLCFAGRERGKTSGPKEPPRWLCARIPQSLSLGSLSPRPVHGDPGKEHPQPGWEGFEALLWFGGLEIF